MRIELQKKVDQALRLIVAAGRRAEERQQLLEIAFSGGKDSEVILELAKMAGTNFVPIYKNTTIDPPGTIAHNRAKGCKIIQPKLSFREIIAKKGFPNRWRRLCCSELKEYPVLDTAVIGVRRAESRARFNRYHEPEVCRVWNKTKHITTRQYLPLLEWTDRDVAEFIEERNIQCHPIYYDENGRFHAERRLGCMCCPLLSKPKRIESFKQYPAMVRYYIRAGEKFLQNHPNCKTAQLFQGNTYDWFVSQVFFDGERQFHETIQYDLFGKSLFSAKEFLMNKFQVDL